MTLDGQQRIAERDLVRFEAEQHPIGRAMHDAGPGEQLDIIGVNIVTLKAPEGDDFNWCRYRVAGELGGGAL